MQINNSNILITGGSLGIGKETKDNKLSPKEIANSIISVLTMNQKGFIPEIKIWATNPL